MLTIKAHIEGDILNSAALKERLGLGKGGRVQIAVDKAVIDYCKPYVPFDTGVLANSAYTMTEMGSGEVIWPGPYAHYQYYGEVYGPNIPIFDDDSGLPTGFYSPPGKSKTPTGRKLQYNTEKNLLAGSFWFERMKADHTQDIVRIAQDTMNNREGS